MIEGLSIVAFVRAATLRTPNGQTACVCDAGSIAVWQDRAHGAQVGFEFLAQVLTFTDAGLEKLYVFARHLRRLLRADRLELPREVQRNIEMEPYRIQQTGSNRIALERKGGALDPQRTKNGCSLAPEEIESLSRIIAELNDRFGLNLGPEHRVTLGQMMEKLDGNAALDAAARVNTRENVRLTFDHKVESVIQEIVDSNFELHKRITDDRGFGEALKNFNRTSASARKNSVPNALHVV